MNHLFYFIFDWFTKKTGQPCLLKKLITINFKRYDAINLYVVKRLKLALKRSILFTTFHWRTLGSLYYAHILLHPKVERSWKNWELNFQHFEACAQKCSPKMYGSQAAETLVAWTSAISSLKLQKQKKLLQAKKYSFYFLNNTTKFEKIWYVSCNEVDHL